MRRSHRATWDRLQRLKLSRDERMLATLRYANGRTYPEIAELLGVTPGRARELVVSLERRVAVAAESTRSPRKGKRTRKATKASGDRQRAKTAAPAAASTAGVSA